MPLRPSEPSASLPAGRNSNPFGLLAVPVDRTWSPSEGRSTASPAAGYPATAAGALSQSGRSGM